MNPIQELLKLKTSNLKDIQEKEQEKSTKPPALPTNLTNHSDNGQNQPIIAHQELIQIQTTKNKAPAFNFREIPAAEADKLIKNIWAWIYDILAYSEEAWPNNKVEEKYFDQVFTTSFCHQKNKDHNSVYASIEFGGIFIIKDRKRRFVLVDTETSFLSKKFGSGTIADLIFNLKIAPFSENFQHISDITPRSNYEQHSDRLPNLLIMIEAFMPEKNLKFLNQYMNQYMRSLILKGLDYNTRYMLILPVGFISNFFLKSDSLELKYESPETAKLSLEKFKTRHVLGLGSILKEENTNFTKSCNFEVRNKLKVLAEKEREEKEAKEIEERIE